MGMTECVLRSGTALGKSSKDSVNDELPATEVDISLATGVSL